MVMADGGDVKFDLDLTNGVVWISVRPPLGLESARVRVAFPLMDFLDMGARTTLSVTKHQRAMMAELMRSSHLTGAPK